MKNCCSWKVYLSLKFIAICVLSHVSAGTELSNRVKRDDGAFAKDFGGPVAQASGPEEDESTENKQGQKPPQTQLQNVGPGQPPAGPQNQQQQNVLPCPFQQKPKQVLFMIASNARFRKRRDEGAFLTNSGGPIASKSIEPELETSNHKPFPPGPASPGSSAPSLPHSFTFLNTTYCQTQEICYQKCQAMPQCNYFMRSFFNYVSYLYQVNPEKLNEGNFTDSLTYDSYFQNCLRGQSNGPVAQSSGPDDDKEDTKKKFIKKLNAFNQKQNAYGKTVAPPYEPANVTSGKTAPPAYAPANVTSEPKCVHLVTDEEAKKAFDQYLNTFNQKFGDESPPGPYGVTTAPAPKTYESAEERDKRYQQFKDNLQIVQQFNCGRKNDESAAFLEVTEFSDQSYEEFISTSGGSSAPVGQDSLKPQISDQGAKLIAKCPKLNWAEQGFVPAPRKQGKCGACYAFSTSDLIASQYHIDRKLKNQTFSLSPQYIVDCMKGPAALGCNGGRPVEVLRNFTKCNSPKGCNIPKEECYPYKGKKDTCKMDACQESPKVPVRFAAINDVTGPMEKEKVAAILNWGPAVVIIDANQAWQFYGGKGIMKSTQCGSMQNHAVLLVGYDYTGPVPYYIIKNSWGDKWGAKGFIKLEADKNTCSVAKSLTICCTHNCDTFKDTMNLVDRPNNEGCL